MVRNTSQLSVEPFQQFPKDVTACCVNSVLTDVDLWWMWYESDIYFDVALDTVASASYAFWPHKKF